MRPRASPPSRSPLVSIHPGGSSFACLGKKKTARGGGGGESKKMNTPCPVPSHRHNNIRSAGGVRRALTGLQSGLCRPFPSEKRSLATEASAEAGAVSAVAGPRRQDALAGREAPGTSPSAGSAAPHARGTAHGRAAVTSHPRRDGIGARR